MAAYLSILGDPPIEGGNNRFSVNGRGSYRIFSGPNLYKIDSGNCTIKIASGNGEEWEVSAQLANDQLLTIKTQLDGCNVADVLYRVGAAEWALKLCAQRLY